MKINIVISFIFVLMSSLFLACAEEGEEGTNTVDCGGHGSEHDGHCHCDSGYLFAEETCLLPESVTLVCEEHEEEADDVVAGDGTDADASAEAEEEHHHEACLCPSSGACHCDSGTVETFGTKSYCVPELHNE